MSTQLLDEFLDFLKPLISDLTECHKLVKHVKKIFNNCDERFRKSSDFKHLVECTKSTLSNDKQRVYVHIMDFVCELKAHVKDSAERGGRNKTNGKHKQKKRERERSSGSDSGELPTKKANHGREMSGAQVQLPNDGIVCESNAGSPYSQEVTSTCSPSVSPARKPKQHSSGNAVSDKKRIVLEFSSSSETVTNSEVAKSANTIDAETCIQKEADSPVVMLGDGSECHSSPQTDVLSNLNLVPRCVDLQSVKAESVSTSPSVFNCEDAPSELTSSSNGKTKVKPSICKEQDSALVVDEKKTGNVLLEPASTSDEVATVKSTCSKEQDSTLAVDDEKKSVAAPSERASTADEETTVQPSCSKKQDSNSAIEDKKAVVSEKHIRKLEILLAKLRNEIERVKERELSLDDLQDEDSSYIYEDRLQKKFVKVWDKLCELKGRRKTTGRPVEKRFRFEGSRYPEINKKIERFINKKKIFPDYHDIRDIVIKVNERKGLKLSSMMVDSTAVDSFKGVVHCLQERRKEDFVTTFGCRLTDSINPDDDPALTDPDLMQKLESNRLEGEDKMEQVMRKYTFSGEEEPEGLGNQSEKEKREMSCSPTNEEEEEEEEVCVPELDEVLNYTVCDLEQENSSDMKMEENEEDVIELSADEEEDDAQSDEDDADDEDNDLPKTFASVLESVHQRKDDTDDDSQDAVLEVKSESDDIQTVDGGDDIVEVDVEDNDDSYEEDDKSDDGSAVMVLDDSVYVDVAEDADVLSMSELSPMTTENTETSDSDAGDLSPEALKSSEPKYRRSRLSIRTPQKSLLRMALGLKSPGKNPKRIHFPMKKKSVECLDDVDDDDDDNSVSDRNISSSVPTKKNRLSAGGHCSKPSNSPNPSTSLQYASGEEVVCTQPEPTPFSLGDPVISSSTGDPTKGPNSDNETEVIILDSD